MLSDVQKKELMSGPYGKVLFDELMKKHTTFQIGGPADAFVSPTSEEELLNVVRYARKEGIPFFIMGNGSNLLVRDKGIRGLVICLDKKFAKISVEGDRVRAQAGALLSTVSKMSFRYDLTGMERVSGIPGSLGGAIAMNAGAYGVEMEDIVESVRAIDKNSQMVVFSNEEMHFAYRHSRVAEEGLIVTEVVFALKKGDRAAIKSEYEDFTEKRVTRQPLEKASAGSTFKRPDGHFASKLIDDAGLRGFRIGGAMVSEKHCGFVINEDNASFADVMELIHEIQRVVREKFGVSLEMEVKVVGEE